MMKKELAEQKEDEDKLAACRKRYQDFGHDMNGWCKMHTGMTPQRDTPLQKLRSSSDCCVTLVVSGECVCRLRYIYLGFVVF